MSRPSLLFAGSGDAFGSGGRLQTCLCLSAGRGSWSTAAPPPSSRSSAPVSTRTTWRPSCSRTCTATTSAGCPCSSSTGGSGAARPTWSWPGPRGTAERLHTLMEAMYPGMSAAPRRFALHVAVTHLSPDMLARVGDLPDDVYVAAEGAVMDL